LNHWARLTQETEETERRDYSISIGTGVSHQHQRCTLLFASASSINHSIDLIFTLHSQCERQFYCDREEWEAMIDIRTQATSLYNRGITATHERGSPLFLTHLSTRGNSQPKCHGAPSTHQTIPDQSKMYLRKGV
jgi:hypothetical protein